MSLPCYSCQSRLRILPVDDRIEQLRASIREADIQRAAQRLSDGLNEPLGKSAASDSKDQPDGRTRNPRTSPELHVRNAVALESVESSAEHERRSSMCPSCRRVRGNAVTVA